MNDLGSSSSHLSSSRSLLLVIRMFISFEEVKT